MFEQVWAMDPSVPTVLYSWAQSERLGGRCAHAVELYTKYRGTKVTPSQDAAAKDGIAQCEKADADAREAAKPHPKPWYAPRLPDDAMIGGGILGIALGFYLFSRANAAAAEAPSATTLEEFHDAAGRASHDHLGGVFAIVGGAALIGGGVYLHWHHHEVQAMTDGHSVAIGARF
jgi:hypothetical protein